MIARIILAAGIGLSLSGCTYDYMQRTDRVAYSAGNAVKANLARETADPQKQSMYSTKGLGKNGSVNPASQAPGAVIVD